jgi:hypothetical protein
MNHVLLVKMITYQQAQKLLGINQNWNYPCLKARIIAAVKNIETPMLTRVCKNLNILLMCAHIEHF